MSSLNTPTPTATPKPKPKLDIPRQIKYWLRNATLLPTQYTPNDASRCSLGFFIVSGLDLLHALPRIPSSELQSWINWIYSLQLPEGGFRGFPGTDLGVYRNVWNKGWDPASLANTHLALLTLVVLGDGLRGVRRKECLKWVGSLQRRNGSFGEFLADDGEVVGGDDLRTVYCAVGIAYMLLGDKEEVPFDMNATLGFVENCQDFDGGCGQSPFREGQSGVNFCAVAAMAILRKLQRQLNEHRRPSSFDVAGNIDWLLQRQTSWVNDEEEDEEEEGDTNVTMMNDATKNAISSEMMLNEAFPSAGFNGRPSKLADTCYCFWNTAALAVFNSSRTIDVPGLRSYLLQDTQHAIGGFSKSPGEHPDVMHSYLGLACLALYREVGVKEVDPIFAVSKEAAGRLEAIRKAWDKNSR